MEIDDRHIIDRTFRCGDAVRLIKFPHVCGRVCEIRNGDVMIQCDGQYSLNSPINIEHAPDDDGITRYHTETGEVFAECGIPTEPCETSDESYRLSKEEKID